MDYSQIIVSTPEVSFGKPRIAGTRITVQDVLDYLGGGMTVDEILTDFPELSIHHIQACLAFVADRERRVVARGL